MVQVERSQHFEETDPIYDLLVDEGNRIWVGSANGLFVFDYYQGVKAIQKETAVNALTIDNKGQVWAGLETGEIMSGDKKHRFPLSNNDGLKITSMTTKDSILWIGTENNGVYVWDVGKMKKVGHHTKSNSKLPSDNINFVQSDRFGVIWMGTKSGVCRADYDNWKTYEKSDNVTAVAKYADDIWFLGNQKLWKVDPQNRWARIRLDRRLTDGVVKDMAFDEEGRLYMASNVFSRYDIIEDTLAVYADKIGFVSDQSLAVTSDKNNNMWVGTAKNGLFRFRLYFREVEEEDIDFSAICFSQKVLDCSDDTDGALGVRVTGGAAPYFFEWSCKGCKGAVAKGLSAGTYTVTVSDSEKRSKVLTTSVLGPEPLAVNLVEKDDVSKGGYKDGRILVGATGGNEDYKFVWENRTKGEERKRLAVGDYKVTVTDEKGCTAEKDFVINGPKIIPDLKIESIEVGQTITMEQLYFTADSLNYKEESMPVLREVYDFLTTHRHVVVEIGGHTNSLPTEEYCQWLSTGRAQNVAEYFYSRGIPESQVFFKGYGKKKPIATNGTKAGRSKNQRVEIKVLQIR